MGSEWSRIKITVRQACCQQPDGTVSSIAVVNYIMKISGSFNGSIGHLRIDGPNFDGQLKKILRRRPRPQDYPDWRAVLLELRKCIAPCDGEIVYAVSTAGDRILGKLRKLREQGLRTPVIAAATHGYDHSDPVDDYIDWQIDRAAVTKDFAPLVLCVHDHGYAKWLAKAIMVGIRVALIGFCEEMAPPLLALRRQGALILDLEYDLHAFGFRLPDRVSADALAAMGVRSVEDGAPSCVGCGSGNPIVRA